MPKEAQSRSQDETDDLGNGTSGATATTTRPAVKTTYRRAPIDGDDMQSGGSAPSRTPVIVPRTTYAGVGASRYAKGEVVGDAPLTTRPAESAGEAGAHEEVGPVAGSEAGEEFAEATREELAAAESGEETAVSDLRAIEGYEATEAGEEAGPVIEPVLREAGETIEGGKEVPEFFGILAALVPTLISTIGPMVAKKVVGRLSTRAAGVLKRLPKQAVGAAVGAATRAGGNGNILGLIAKLFESAQESGSGNESDAEGQVDEAFLQEAAAAIEVIIGTDDRVRITQTMNVPWRRVCALRISFPSGSTFRGTGFLIGPRAVATAGHCVFMHNQGGWARSVEVIPGCNGSSRPYGQAVSTTLRSVGGWVNSKLPESDYGCIILPPGGFSQNLGSFGFAAFDAPTLLAKPAVMAGFPGDKPFAELWGMKRLIKTVTAKTLVYDIDSMGGQSGAPVYIKRNGQRYVVGIHNYGASTGNSATRVTQPVYERLLAWSQIGGVTV